jgi:hypothetical protein
VLRSRTSPVTSMLSSLIQARWLTGASCAATCVAWLVARSHRLACKRDGEREALVQWAAAYERRQREGRVRRTPFCRMHP